MDNGRQMVRVGYVMDSLGVSRATAYRVITSLNEELSARGVRVMQGRVDRDYFESRFFSTRGEGDDRVHH